jgi:hypothetical protein
MTTYTFALCGQSNMAGFAPLPLFQTTSNNIQVWRGTWQTAAEPIHGNGYAGPGLAFAVSLLALLGPSAQIRLIPCAVSGTSIEQWQRGQTVYQDAVTKTCAALAGGTLSGVLFSQGEADTFDQAKAGNWATLALQFARDFRTDTGRLEVPFIYAQLGSNPGDPARVAWDALRDTIQPSLYNPAVYPYIRMVRTLDLPTVAQHFTGDGYASVGSRFAAAYYGAF